MATSVMNECGRMRVSVVEHSDGSISVSYLPAAIEEPEMDPANVDERSTEDILNHLHELARISAGLERTFRKMEKKVKEVEATPLVKLNPVDLLPERKRVMHRIMSRRMANPWCAQVVRDLEEEAKLVVGPPKDKGRRLPDVRVVMVGGVAMEEPV